MAGTKSKECSRGVHDFCRADRGSVHHDGHTRHGSGHGAANVDCARHPPQPALADLFWPRRYPDRVHVSQHRTIALGLLSGPSRSDVAQNPNETFCHFILYQMPVGLRGLLIAGIFATAMGSLSTAINALATSFTRDWYEPYINPAINRGTEPARRPLGHGVVFDPDDYRRIDHVLPRHRASERADHPDRARDFRLHVRIAARRFPMRDVHQTARQRLGKHRRDDHRLHRRRDFERSTKQNCRPVRR